MGRVSLRFVLPILGALVCVHLPANSAGASAPSPAPLIVIDPGHGGRYSNANANRLKEKNVNLAVARELRSQLLARGYRVAMTRSTDRAVRFADTKTWNYSRGSGLWSYAYDGRRGYVGGIPRDDLQARVDIANRLGAELFISIHANAAGSRSARGTETWASRKDYLGRKLAPIVSREIARATGLKNRGAHTADFYVCRWSNMPAVLVESAFITSPRDARLLKRRWFRRRIARGIATGVDKWMATSPYRRLYPRVSASSPSALAVAVSRKDFASGAGTVVLARADRVTEVPGTAALAHDLDAPLLLTGPSGPDSATASELARLAPHRLVLAGVDGSLDASCVANVAKASGVETSAVESAGGPHPASAAASIAELMGVGPTGEIIVAAAEDPTDKLIAAAAAASADIPLILVSRGSIDARTSSWLAENRARIRRSIVVGRAARSSRLTSWRLPNVYRIDGPDSAYNAYRLNARRFPARSVPIRPVIASMSSTGGYLVAASHAARINQPLAPVRGVRLYANTRMWITNRRAAIRGFEVVSVGSTSSLIDRALAKSDAL